MSRNNDKIANLTRQIKDIQEVRKGYEEEQKKYRKDGYQYNKLEKKIESLNQMEQRFDSEINSLKG